MHPKSSAHAHANTRARTHARTKLRHISLYSFRTVTGSASGSRFERTKEKRKRGKKGKHKRTKKAEETAKEKIQKAAEKAHKAEEKARKTTEKTCAKPGEKRKGKANADSYDSHEHRTRSKTQQKVPSQ